jgi:hypothetical protein
MRKSMLSWEDVVLKVRAAKAKKDAKAAAGPSGESGGAGKAGGGRKCGICGQQGHNKKTCPKRPVGA